MSHQTKNFYVNETPGELTSCKISHICRCDFKILFTFLCWIIIITIENNNKKENKDTLFDLPKIITLGAKTATSNQKGLRLHELHQITKKCFTEIYH